MSRDYIAQKLQELREATGKTANEVGELIGKSGKTVNAWENGRGQPDADTLIMLCDLYGVDNILDEFREIKKAPASDTTDTGADEQLEARTKQIYELLVSLGYISEGEDLSEKKFIAINAMFDALFAD